MAKITGKVECFIDEVRTLYREIIIGSTSRVKRGDALWDQFETAVKDCRVNGSSRYMYLTERVNELAVAKVLVEDPHLKGQIEYEPNLLPSGRKIDFVVSREHDNLYIEVKTVHPQTPDTQREWDRHLRRTEFHPSNIVFHVEQEWMGGEISGKFYASRAHFLDYTLEFESRLATAKTKREGWGILVFCGNGFDWHLSNLEDFADFYFTGSHRQDDLYGLMEQHSISNKNIQLLRNVDHFACLQRSIICANAKPLIMPVRGPHFGASRPSMPIKEGGMNKNQ